MSRWRIEFEVGSSITLPGSAIVVGRSSSCDVVLSGPTISRRQLLLRARLEGVEVVNLGRRPVTRRGEPLGDAALLDDGDPLELDGAPLATIRAHASVPGTARWLLRVDEGPAVGMTRTPFSIGGGADDLRVEGWPPAAVQLQDVGHRLIASASEQLELDASELAQFDERIAPLELGRPLRVLGRELRLALLDPAAEATTLSIVDRPEPYALRLEPYARGGLLTVKGRGSNYKVYLAGRRFALVRALVKPAPPVEPGALRSVKELCREIWPEDPIKDETDFNVLIYRVRRDLVDAGLDADLLIERIRGSGMVRSPLAAEAKIESIPSPS